MRTIRFSKECCLASDLYGQGSGMMVISRVMKVHKAEFKHLEFGASVGIN